MELVRRSFASCLCMALDWQVGRRTRRRHSNGSNGLRTVAYRRRSSSLGGTRCSQRATGLKRRTIVGGGRRPTRRSAAAPKERPFGTKVWLGWNGPPRMGVRTRSSTWECWRGRLQRLSGCFGARLLKGAPVPPTNLVFVTVKVKALRRMMPTRCRPILTLRDGGTPLVRLRWLMGISWASALRKTAHLRTHGSTSQPPTAMRMPLRRVIAWKPQ